MSELGTLNSGVGENIQNNISKKKLKKKEKRKQQRIRQALLTNEEEAKFNDPIYSQLLEQEEALHKEQEEIERQEQHRRWEESERLTLQAAEVKLRKEREREEVKYIL